MKGVNSWSNWNKNHIKQSEIINRGRKREFEIQAKNKVLCLSSFQ